MKKALTIASMVALTAFSGLAFAQQPAKDIDPKLHPNLAAAQDLIVQAWDKLGQAQKANEDDLGGHAQKAKDMLDKANNLIKQAATAANKNKK
jgi:hypothetical protein